MSFDFHRGAAEHEPAWEDLQVALQRWVLAHGGSAQLTRIAGWASLADAQGHAALDLCAGSPGLEALDADAIAALRAQPLVGDGQATTAFVIDAAGRFFLWRNHAREVAIAAQVHARAAPLQLPQPQPEDVDILFQGRREPAIEAQRAAVAGLPLQRIGVLTGGPGTGKTTTVLRVLAMAQRLRACIGQAPARIAIAAPTGKAAQRLVQALREGKRALQAGAHALPEDWHALLATIPDAQATTVHRLLGYRPWDGRHARDAQSPLDADIVVIDEASMLDLAQLHALLQALPAQAQLLLVGDADQLTSVGTGTVLMDLVAAFAGSARLQRLTHVFRSAQAPLLTRAVQAARTGDAPALHAALADGGDELRMNPVADMPGLLARLHAWADMLAALPLRGNPGAPADAARALAALDALASHQLLTALREGDFGSDACNARIEQRLRLRWELPAEQPWFPGRALMVTRNDPANGLFNGDVGVCLDDGGGGVRVWFETSSRDGARHARSLPPAALPEHAGAFAATIHKSQGSEYAQVALLLPPDPAHRILSRQLLYTGLSRARQSVQLWATPAATDAALAHLVARVGGLRERLLAVAGGA